jgi:hypothetical protein
MRGWAKRTIAINMALPLAAGVVAGALTAGTVAVFALRAPTPAQEARAVRSEITWSEMTWPFPIDQWGLGKAFRCGPADCGTTIDVFLRPKIGFCNCTSGVSDEAELARIGDTGLIDPAPEASGPGRALQVGWMAGMSRTYRLPGRSANTNLLSLAFNDECDVIVALAVTEDADPGAAEAVVLSFLNTDRMVLWAKKELGLEFMHREWKKAN